MDVLAASAIQLFIMMKFTPGIYIVLSIAFVATWLYVFLNNMRVNARLKELERRGGYHPQGPQEAVIAAKRVEEREKQHH